MKYGLFGLMMPVLCGKVMLPYAEGYEDVRLIKTTNGMFMSPGEAKLMLLAGSTLLFGRK